MGDVTPRYGFPYPVGTDLLRDGDNAIKALAEGVEAQIGTTEDTLLNYVVAGRQTILSNATGDFVLDMTPHGWPADGVVDAIVFQNWGPFAGPIRLFLWIDGFIANVRDIAGTNWAGYADVAYIVMGHRAAAGEDPTILNPVLA